MNNGDVYIADYALIGNCRSAALVSKHGSIDWCCIPEFHSQAIFAALLDKEKGGFFVIQPVHQYSCRQSYAGDTNVVQTLFTYNEGTVKITDCFVAMEEVDKQKELFPDHEILRIVEAVKGSVEMKFEYFPKPGYGKRSADLKNYGKLGVHFTYKENIVVFQTTIEELEFSREKVSGKFVLNEGQVAVFSLSCSAQYPAIIPEIKQTAQQRLQNTLRYWQSWISKCKYDGVFKPLVLRSVLALKLLTHAPSGAIIAAPTTSLPEEIGGIRNWDYRYCWLRDASFTVRVLIKLGYYEEAHAYMSWILHATRLTQPKLQVVYTVFGDSRIREKTCDWLKGYKNSAPVRIGNDAHDQFQLDVYGEVLDAVFTYSKIIEGFDKGTQRFIIGLGKTICRIWSKPDEGIWEIRSQALQHTHSKVMAWVGLDRIIKLCKKYDWKKVPLDEFEKTKKMIAASVEDFGYNKELNTYIKDYNSKETDAALLTLSLVDYCPANSSRMVSTVQQIKQQLQKNNFIYRYRNSDDGLSGNEGAFVVAGFWMIENLAKQGEVEKAIEMFEKMISAAPEHHLLAEEIHPDSNEWLGNYPQGFSHIGLINATLSISAQIEKQKEHAGR